MKYVAARRYTLDEIDSMREAIRRANEANSYYPLDYESYGSHGWSNLAGNWEQELRDRTERVEQELRTCMMGGVGPNELLEKQKQAEAAMQQRIAAFSELQIERLLTAEYGPR